MSTLIERIEAATGPDRIIDELILLAIGWTFERAPSLGERATWVDLEGKRTAHWQGDGWFRPTASIDAALTLVPNGHTWCVTSCGEDDRPAACVTLQDFDEGCPDFTGSADTEALALCAAALKARKLT
jgi:hypothetical protein